MTSSDDKYGEDFDPRWLEPGGVVPVDAKTVGTLIRVLSEWIAAHRDLTLRVAKAEAAARSAILPSRECTCHPDDNPPKPCPQKFALSECRAAAAPVADDSHYSEATKTILRFYPTHDDLMRLMATWNNTLGTPLTRYKAIWDVVTLTLAHALETSTEARANDPVTAAPDGAVASTLSHDADSAPTFAEQLRGPCPVCGSARSATVPMKRHCQHIVALDCADAGVCDQAGGHCTIPMNPSERTAEAK